MCGTKSRTFWLLLAALLLQPCSSSWGAVVLTDEQETALNQHLDELEKEAKEQKSTIKELKNQLAEAKSELESAKKELTESNRALNEVKDTSVQLEKYLKKEKREARLDKAKAFCIGLAIGAAGGLAGGYYLTR